MSETTVKEFEQACFKHLHGKHNQKLHGSRYNITARQAGEIARQRADTEWREGAWYHEGNKKRFTSRIQRETLSSRKLIEKKVPTPQEPKIKVIKTVTGSELKAWKKGTVSKTVISGNGYKRADTEGFENKQTGLGVYKGPSGWIVTHNQSGLAVPGTYGNQRDAIIAASLLAKNFDFTPASLNIPQLAKIMSELGGEVGLPSLVQNPDVIQ